MQLMTTDYANVCHSLSCWLAHAWLTCGAAYFCTAAECTRAIFWGELKGDGMWIPYMDLEVSTEICTYLF